MSKELLDNRELDVVSEYLTSPQLRAYLIHPQIYVGKHSRGTGKTNRIQALRTCRTGFFDVPGSVNVFYGMTFIGLQMRTLPGTLAGWKSFGIIEGRDWVKNVEPPRSWPKPHDYEPLTYKNTISTKSGSIYILGSNDRPGLVNSLSITGHVSIDEFRFINHERMVQDLFPAIRGNTKFWDKNNPHLFSMTITGDQPFLEDDADWIDDYQKLMKLEQIYLIAQASIKVEKVKRKILQVKKKLKTAKLYKDRVELIQKINTLTLTYNKKLRYLNIARLKSTYYDTGSALTNIHVLKKDYLLRNADPNVVKKLIFKTSFLNLKPDEVENKFYAQLASRHFTQGNFDYDKLDLLYIDDKFVIDAIQIRDYDPNRPVDIEFDYGDMCSCSVSQTFGREERYIATFEVVLPLDIDDLVTIVNNFLRHHKYKVINLYKDPSGNYAKNRKKQVYGLQTINAFKAYGWHVVDRCPEGSINPEHSAKHQLISIILKETNPRFPIVRIIHETNSNLTSSLKKAPLLMKINNRYGTKEITKDKSSEKNTALDDKPDSTTDHSDHFDVKLWHKYNHLLPSSNAALPFDIASK